VGRARFREISGIKDTAFDARFRETEVVEGASPPGRLARFVAAKRRSRASIALGFEAP